MGLGELFFLIFVFLAVLVFVFDLAFGLFVWFGDLVLGQSSFMALFRL